MHITCPQNADTFDPHLFLDLSVFGGDILPVSLLTCLLSLHIRHRPGVAALAVLPALKDRGKAELVNDPRH